MQRQPDLRTAWPRYKRDEATVRVSATSAIPAVLIRLGLDPAKVLRDAGFDPQLLDDAENRMSFVARARLVRHCADATDCEHFGLLVGQQNDLPCLGLVGLLVKYAPDVGTALRSLVRYFHLHVQGAALDLTIDGDLAVLSYYVYLPKVEAIEHLGDGAIAALFNAMHTLCGPDWVPVEVRLAHRKPKDVRPYRQFFRVPVQFDAERYSLVFAADCLDLPVSNIDPELRRLLQQQIDALAAAHGSDFPEQVRRVLRTALLTHHSKADQVAALFSMHRRTLCRHLTAVGTSFQQLIDETRFEIARQLLEDSEMDVGQVADTLDYSDARAFSRAFRRWSGTTPVLWRMQHSERRRRTR